MESRAHAGVLVGEDCPPCSHNGLDPTFRATTRMLSNAYQYDIWHTDIHRERKVPCPLPFKPSHFRPCVFQAAGPVAPPLPLARSCCLLASWAMACLTSLLRGCAPRHEHLLASERALMQDPTLKTHWYHLYRYPPPCNHPRVGFASVHWYTEETIKAGRTTDDKPALAFWGRCGQIGVVLSPPKVAQTIKSCMTTANAVRNCIVSMCASGPCRTWRTLRCCLAAKVPKS